MNLIEVRIEDADPTRRMEYGACWADNTEQIMSAWGVPGAVCPNRGVEPLGLCPLHHLQITGRDLTEEEVA